MDLHYGETFKKLRLAKGIGLKELVSSELSYSQLQKFENGISRISMDKLFLALLGINITAEEYQRAYYEATNNSEFIYNTQVSNAYAKRDKAQLKKLLNLMKEKINIFPEIQRYRLNYIHIMALLHEIDSNFKVPNKEIAYLQNYFLSLQEFSEYELFLFGSTVDLFDNKNLASLITKIIHPQHSYLDSFTHNRRIINCVLNTINIFLRRDYLPPIQELINYLKQSLNSDFYMYEKASLTYLQALYLLKSNPNNAEALEIIEKCVSAFELFDCFDTLNALQGDFRPFNEKNR